MAEQDEHQEWVTEIWRTFLTTGEIPADIWPYPISYGNYRRFMRVLPSNPRCWLCEAPFEGAGGQLLRVLTGRERSRLNPLMCNACEQFAMAFKGGAEVELSMLFADVRGSTSLAEGMSPLDFSRLIDRFYAEASHVLIHRRALIEKLIGDEVAGLFVPGLSPEHAREAIEAAQEILRATGHGSQQGPWIPVGVGVHTGVAFVGSVGQLSGVTTITALGDAVNTAARLASAAGPGEILVSADAREASGISLDGSEGRHLQLKGRAEPLQVHVLRLSGEL